MSSWKYVMMEVDCTTGDHRNKVYIPILFAPEITHLDMAEAMMRSFQRKRRMAIPRSAGFVAFSFDEDGLLKQRATEREKKEPSGEGALVGELKGGMGYAIWTYGESESLRMKAHPDDVGIIFTVNKRNQFFYD